MEQFINNFSLLWSDHRYLIVGIAAFLWVTVSWLLIKYVFILFEKVAKKTSNRFDDLLFEEARLPVWLLFLVAGSSFVFQVIELPKRIAPYIERFNELAVIFAIIYFIARMILALISFASKRNLGLKDMKITFSRLINVIIWGAAILMLMDLFGISITPLLASLGIAGLAIGLALQDTLGNFFSGIYILLSQPVRVNDYIELENGLKGYVTNIGWRETRIRTLPNNTVVVPNSKLSQSIITNYYLPQKEMACLVQVGVSYASDLEKVEKVTIEVGKEVLQRVTGGIKTFDPFIRYHTFADFSINFTVILRIGEFVDQYLVTHEFVKALHKRYKAEGIEIPFPIRTIIKKGN